jgi:hypothetical protein
MHRDHGQARIQQPVDQQPIRSLERDQRDLQMSQPCAQRPDPFLAVPIPAPFQNPASLIDHARRVLLAGPIDPSKPTIRHDHHTPSNAD